MTRHFTTSIKMGAFLALTAAVCASWHSAAWGTPITVVRTTADGGADARIGGLQVGGTVDPFDQTNTNYGNVDEAWARWLTGSTQRYEKAYMRFRLPSDISTLDTAQLQLWMRPNQNKSYQLWGLNLPAADAYNGYGHNGVADMARLGADWAEDQITWNNAPGNVNATQSNSLNGTYATQLYTFDSGNLTSGSGITNGISLLTNNNGTKTTALVNFLNNHIANGSEYVTFIVVTTTNNSNSGGFITKEHANVLSQTWHAPQISLTYTPIPEPATYTLLGGCLAALAASRRRRTT